MPKYNNNESLSISFNDTGRTYFYHDDRRGGNNNRPYNPRKKFTPRRGGGQAGYFQDEDVDMDSKGKHNRRSFQPYTRGRRGYRGYSYSRRGGSNPNQSVFFNHNGWFRVQISHGNLYEKDYITRTLNNRIKTSFIPINYQVEGNYAIFFIKNPDLALDLRNLDMTVCAGNGQKLSIRVYTSGSPYIKFDEDIKSKLAVAMSNSYDVNRKALDLANFDQKTDLRAEGLYLPLCQNIVLENVMSIILEHIPELQELDVSGNDLKNLHHLRSLKKESVKNLTKLVMRNNNLRSIATLDPIQGLGIEELDLGGNNIITKYKDNVAYVSKLRKMFPKLQILDEKMLPPVISFDVEQSEGKIPASRPHYTPDMEAQTIVGQFVEQYFKIFDSGNRHPLLDAYFETAVFSLICTSKVTSFMSESRNLMRVRDFERRQKFLKNGKVTIVSFLSQLPSTQHDLQSFSVDISTMFPNIIEFAISGVLKEAEDEQHPPIHSFSRLFVIAKVGTGGFCILNDHLYLSSPTGEQIKNAFKAPAPTPSPSPTPQAATSFVNASPVSAQIPLEKSDVVIAFSKQSRMNHDWSLKCLQDNHWNFEAAAAMFNNLNSAGKIPPEAFHNP